MKTFALVPMRNLLLLLMLFVTIPAIRAQDNIQYEIDAVLNRLYSDTAFANALFPLDTTPDYLSKKWDEVADSVTTLIVKKHVAEDVVLTDKYPYPGFALQIQASPTYAYILQTKYNILRPVGHGCIIPYYQRKYDSLVTEELKNKFGRDIFEGTFKEAKDLDIQNRGLQLPRVKDSINILAHLKQEIPNWDTMCNSIPPSNSLEYLIMTFNRNTVIHVSLAEASWGIQPLLNIEMPPGLVESALNKLTWRAAMYKGKQVNKTVVLNLITNELSWLNYWD
jgi:hypothetical protein